MPKPQPLALQAVISNTGTPITFAGGSGEAGTLKLQFYGTGAEIERLLALRGRQLMWSSRRAMPKQHARPTTLPALDHLTAKQHDILLALVEAGCPLGRTDLAEAAKVDRKTVWATFQKPESVKAYTMGPGRRWRHRLHRTLSERGIRRGGWPLCRLCAAGRGRGHAPGPRNAAGAVPVPAVRAGPGGHDRPPLPGRRRLRRRPPRPALLPSAPGVERLQQALRRGARWRTG